MSWTLEENAKIYVDVPSCNREVNEQAIIMYMMKYNLTLSDILDQLSECLTNALLVERDEVVRLEEKLREQALRQVGAMLTKDEITMITER